MNKYTISRAYQEEICLEKSRFICSLAKVQNEAEAQEFIRQQKKRYWDATHNCSAYVIGKNSVAERSSDDGEPSGTAGLPMLMVLRRQELYDVVAVVTRYFGGIKLGAGGLARAYAHSVTTALKGAGLAQVVPMGIYSFTWELTAVGKVLNLLYGQKLFTVDGVDYQARAVIRLRLEVQDKLAAESWLTENLRHKIELKEEKCFGEEREICENS